MDEIDQLRDDHEELKQDVTQIAAAMSSYGLIMTQVIRALEGANIPISGVTLPTLQ